MEQFHFTTDGDLTSYLSYKGRKIVSIGTDPDSKKVIFGFDASPELTKEIEAYYFDSTTVIPRTFAIHIRRIRTIISTTKRNVVGRGV